jgi:glycosyltransferase involved in cell wall biosynthesis
MNLSGYCFIIPNYNHHLKIEETIQELSGFDIPIIIIDDGSDQQTKDVLNQVIKHFSCVSMITHEKNQGKGAAVINGLVKAREIGCTHGIQVDADGQHNLLDIKKLIKCSNDFPKALVSGRPIYDDSVPKSRLYGRYITHFWVWVETLSFKVIDSMCGFRVYPVEASVKLINDVKIGTGMDFDTDIMVRLFWRNVEMKFIATKVIYPEDGLSHFNALNDNILISWLHTRLFFKMLLISPYLILNKWRKN